MEEQLQSIIDHYRDIDTEAARTRRAHWKQTSLSRAFLEQHGSADLPPILPTAGEISALDHRGGTPDDAGAPERSQEDETPPGELFKEK